MRTDATTPFTIAAPRFGVLNLVGTKVASQVGEDRVVLEALFEDAIIGEEAPPVCDVLFLYARIKPDGSLDGSSHTLRELIYLAQAPIVVVASENSGELYIAASKRPGSGRANLVMTLDRRGPVFANFFRQLFDAMFAGATMPVAWVKLAPQTSGDPNPDTCPGAIFACEAGQIAFRRTSVPPRS